MQLFNCINSSNTLWYENHRKKIKHFLKSDRAFSRLREDTAPGNFCGITLCSNRWTVRGTLLQRILCHWDVFQELFGEILDGKVDSEFGGQVTGV